MTNASSTRYGYNATASWDPPTNNATPIAGYSITRNWTWSGRPRSVTWTVGNVNSISFPLYPTGAVSHKGITVTPIDENGNFGVSSGHLAFNSPPNNLPPIAVDDAYDATEDVTLSIDVASGIRANDIDTDNTPLINPLTVSKLSDPAHGTLTLSSAGSFIYQPDANFSGLDTFTYRVNDGLFSSDPATVTIDVAPVNDAPSALFDYYSVTRGTTLIIDAAAGVLANDKDVDGDPLVVTLVSGPAGGNVTVLDDGSFEYTPNLDFVGVDTFTYTINDGTVDSNTATASITVMGDSKFFVVDRTAKSTFEYDESGTLVENYGLARANRGPMGVAANAEGTLVWTIDRSKNVFVYDDAGSLLGRWKATGIGRPEGIATDGTDLWIADRRTKKVYHFEGGASLRSGTVAATSTFSLDGKNRVPRGITTDGTHLWVVNDTRKVDRVFKYTVGGDLVGSWIIDSRNFRPTGITIDPDNVNHVWIVDARFDQVFQYNNAAGLSSGTLPASFEIPLAAGNSNPQGIADPSSLSIQSVETSPAIQESDVATHDLWQNDLDPLDTNGDSRITALDALQVINHLSRSPLGSLADGDAMVDVNQDGRATVADALMVINKLNETSAPAEPSEITDIAINEFLNDEDDRLLTDAAHTLF